MPGLGGRWLALALLSGCSAGPRSLLDSQSTGDRHAETFLKRGYRFDGPRAVSVTASGDDARVLQRAFQRYSIEVEKAPSRYEIEVEGTCGNAGISVYAFTMLRVDVYDQGTKVFSARLDNREDCPGAFFGEVGAALARNWNQ